MKRSVRYPRRAPSGTSIVAVLALLLALSGTSAAAVSLALPRNSVGTTQLKTNSVTSAKIATGGVASSDVKNHSLLHSDFARGQIPAGPTGPRGPSNAYARLLTGPVAVPFHAEATVASLGIPQAGNYVILSKALLSGHGSVTCRLEAESDFDISQATPAASSGQTIGNIVFHVFASSGTVDVKCSGDGDAGASFIKIAAIRVGSLTTLSG